MLRRVSLLILGSTLSVAVIAAGPAPPREKPPEVSTVGTVPAVLTEADQAKLVEVLRRLAVQGAQAPALQSPSPWFATLPIVAKAPDFETRTPSVGVRDRTKPVEPGSGPAVPVQGGRP
jgi:hypothetical protein